MKFIKVPFSIWEKNLSPNAFKTYCALLSFANRNNTLTAKIATIAKRGKNSTSSVYRGIEELIDAGLITKQNRFLNGHYISSRYNIVNQTGKFTKMPVSAFEIKINAHGFMVYAFLLKCTGKNRLSFPSLRQMCKDTYLSVTTIIKHVKALGIYEVIGTEHYIKLDGSFGHNQHRICSGYFNTMTSKTEKREGNDDSLLSLFRASIKNTIKSVKRKFNLDIVYE